ncbi:MAG: hypothetical protein OER04_19615 [Cyclobacteriaceae bacterium]|nr:hypothetical protein [Cyclobacteriaceae bacterium]
MGYTDGFHLVIGAVELSELCYCFYLKPLDMVQFCLSAPWLGQWQPHIMNGEATYVMMPLVFLLSLVVVLWGRMPAPIKKLFSGSN